MFAHIFSLKFSCLRLLFAQFYMRNRKEKLFRKTELEKVKALFGWEIQLPISRFFLTLIHYLTIIVEEIVFSISWVLDKIEISKLELLKIK